MEWTVLLHPDFEPEFLVLPEAAQEGIAMRTELLMEFGPNLGRPNIDTLSGSSHSNMKEIRFSAGNGVWRITFAFDPKRQAILLVAGDKKGANQKRFYKDLIALADKRFSDWLEGQGEVQWR